MGDMFEVKVPALNETSNSITEYGQKLQTLLEDFDAVMTTLAKEGLNGGLDTSALNAYSAVKESLDGYAVNIINIGTTVGNVADRTKSAVDVLGGQISAN